MIEGKKFTKHHFKEKQKPFSKIWLIEIVVNRTKNTTMYSDQKKNPFSRLKAKPRKCQIFLRNSLGIPKEFLRNIL